MIAHADPGGGIPQWACKTAINAVAPIEPFKLIHRINENVKRSTKLGRTEMASKGKRRPAGLSQMGYACFWPKGVVDGDDGCDTNDNEFSMGQQEGGDNIVIGNSMEEQPPQSLGMPTAADAYGSDSQQEQNGGTTEMRNNE